MKRAQLQGVPWHEEQMKRTCKDGSKYCLYNHNICSCKASNHYHKKCVGKGACDEFESKGNTAKVLNDKSIPIKPVASNKKEINMATPENTKESKEEKFLRLYKGRIDKIAEAIDNLENLSDKYSYSYTDKQVDKMFDYLEDKLQQAKNRFKNKNNGFEW